MTTTKYVPNKATLQYTSDLGQMAAQVEKGETLESGAKIALAVAAMRNGNIAYVKNTSNESFGWKGLESTAQLPELVNHNVAKQDLSRAVRVVVTFMPDVLTCDDDDVLSHVLAFTSQYGKLNAAYDAYRIQVAEAEGREPRVTSWTLDSALDTVVRKARKENIDPFVVTESFERAMKAFYSGE